MKKISNRDNLKHEKKRRQSNLKQLYRLDCKYCRRADFSSADKEPSSADKEPFFGMVPALTCAIDFWAEIESKRVRLGGPEAPL